MIEEMCVWFLCAASSFSASTPVSWPKARATAPISATMVRTASAQTGSE